MAKVSVIMPVYNKEDQLEKSIVSVLNQTFDDFKLIIVNDGSTDASTKIIKKYSNDSRIVYVEHQNRGVSFTRNRGIDVADTPYISFLDADDEYAPTFLEKMYSVIGNSNLVYCGYFNKNCDNDITKSQIKFKEGDIIEEYLYNICTPNMNCWLIKKEYLKRFNLKFSEELNWGEDMEFLSKILLHDTDVKYIRENLTYYNRGVENALSTETLDKIKKDIICMEKFKQYVSEMALNEEKKYRVIKAIDSYRLPGNIIYRMNRNFGNTDKTNLINIYNENKKYINNIRFTNGLRSIKLILYYLKIFRKINC